MSRPIQPSGTASTGTTRVAASTANRSATTTSVGRTRAHRESAAFARSARGDVYAGLVLHLGRSHLSAPEP